jgi:hypothetical protein
MVESSSQRQSPSNAPVFLRIASVKSRVACKAWGFSLFSRAALFVCLLCSSILAAQSNSFVGAMGGISTLSADGRSVVTSSSAAISLYKPENGLSLQLVAGRHLTGYLSAQGTYGWNRNSITLTSSRTSAEQTAFYEQPREASTHTAMGELMVYVRRRESRLRPYLSAGAGMTRVASGAQTIGPVEGALTPVPGAFNSTKPAFRVAVGIDWLLGGGWAFRFTFSETIRQNAISKQLTPPGERNLANFQNLFGFVKRF